MGGHEHHADYGSRLLWGAVLNLLIPVGQIIGGLAANSLGLISDALHNLSDVVALVLGYAADRVSRRPATLRRTYAFKRAEIIAAFVNAAGLVGVSIFIIVEAVRRLFAPQPVVGLIVMIAAAAGLVVNTISALLLRRHGGNLNVKAAFLHLVGDAVTSLGVVVGGLCVVLFQWYWVDAVVSLAIAVWMCREAGKILRGSMAILMEGVPEGLDIPTIEEAMVGVPGVRGVHDLHVWAISSHDFAMSAHVEVDEQQVADLRSVLRPLKDLLRERFAIEHATLEPESPSGFCLGGVCPADGGSAAATAAIAAEDGGQGASPSVSA